MSSAPSVTPSMMPLSSLTNAPTIAPLNTGTPVSPNEVTLVKFLIYIIVTALILCFLVYLNNRRSEQPVATPTTVPATTNAQDHVDLVKQMTPEERKVYVTNFLKTQKFVDEDHTNRSTASSSFRVTKSSSRQLNTTTSKDGDDDIESNMSVSEFIRNGSPSNSSFKSYPSCAICLDRFKDGEDICSAQNKECPHEFHLECLFPWLLKSQDCPCCRRDYLTIEPTATDETTIIETTNN